MNLPLAVHRPTMEQLIAIYHIYLYKFLMQACISKFKQKRYIVIYKKPLVALRGTCINSIKAIDYTEMNSAKDI